VKRGTISAALAALVAMGEVRAEQRVFDTEAEKGRRVATLLQQAQARLASSTPGIPDPCGPLLQLLAADSAEVQFVEPVVRTADPDHPELMNRRRCTSPSAPASDPFRVYRFRMDGDASGAMEEYVYEQWGGYQSRETERCRVRDAVPTTPAADSYSALIRFRGAVYIFELDISPDKPGYHFALWQLDARNRRFSEACVVNTRPPSPSPAPSPTRRRPRDMFWPHHY
jgi:hypothetical protein